MSSVAFSVACALQSPARRLTLDSVVEEEEEEEVVDVPLATLT